jgi:hypothetical protein
MTFVKVYPQVIKRSTFLGALNAGASVRRVDLIGLATFSSRKNPFFARKSDRLIGFAPSISEIKRPVVPTSLGYFLCN